MTAFLKRPGKLLSWAIPFLIFFAMPLHASELLLVHGRIYTATPGHLWAEALAINGGYIVAVGNDAQILRLKNARSTVIDLHGKMVVPGFTDNHVHLWLGSQVLAGFNLSTPSSNITPDDRKLFIARIRAFAASHPKSAILVGRTAISSGVDEHGVGEPAPDRSLLDQAVNDRPVVIHATSEHTLFVNSKALEMAGITDKPLADPAEESNVRRDAAGHPTGILTDAAMAAIERGLPELSMDEKVQILARGERYLNSFGITSVVLATGGMKDLEAYAALRRRGLLTLRMRQAFGNVGVNHRLTPQFLEEMETARARYHDDWIAADMVKFFMDGAPSEPLYSVESFSKVVKELDKRGFQVMTHALSPEAIHITLDGYDAVEKANGLHDSRFRIEHAGRMTPHDLSRVASLKIIPSMQPAFCCMLTTTATPGYPPAKVQQWNSLEKSGAQLEFSSDWPCSAWPPSPLLGIQQGTQRLVRRDVSPHGPVGPIRADDLPEERITAEQGLIAYTRNAAFANRTEKKLGTLAAGKLADFVILSQNLLSVPKGKIGETKVLATVVGGKIVYGRWN